MRICAVPLAPVRIVSPVLKLSPFTGVCSLPFAESIFTSPVTNWNSPPFRRAQDARHKEHQDHAGNAKTSGK